MSRDTTTSVSWPLAGDQLCVCCWQSYPFDNEYRCAVCDEARCFDCVVLLVESGAVLCHRCRDEAGGPEI